MKVILILTSVSLLTLFSTDKTMNESKSVKSLYLSVLCCCNKIKPKEEVYLAQESGSWKAPNSRELAFGKGPVHYNLTEN